ncbi:isochorismatase family protein [Mucilaginibacter sp. McL0603]|uniref:isochorismatase family protein n=1 Tax=Mucilaginibacter sp. McL0603 TaxID=3415670 RepID=UPI003CF57F78
MNPSPKLLSPANHALVLIDFQGQMAFATKSIDMNELRTNVDIIAGASKIFNVPTVVTTVAEETFSGPVFPEVEESYPQLTSGYLNRTSMNTWEDKAAYQAIVGKGKQKIVFAGLWTSVCIVSAVLSAIAENYETYFITDACGDLTAEAHERAVERMVQAGAYPTTSLQYLLELQRDWARTETYEAVMQLAMKHAGAYGIGIQYARKMLHH